MNQLTTHNLEPDRHRIAALDGVRGVAVLLVMSFHFSYLFPMAGLSWLNRLLSFGWIGVDIFFALSGFLITGVLLSTRGASNYYSGFYIRRVLRIFPIYYLTLAVVAALTTLPALRSVPMPTAREWPFYILFLVNAVTVWRQDWAGTAFTHFWSLAVEEQFYLVWPACVALLSIGVLSRVAAAGVVALVALRVYWYLHLPGQIAFDLSAVTRFDGLLIGSLCAILYVNASEGRNAKPVLWAAFGLIGFELGAIFFPGADSAFTAVRFTFIAIAASALVLLLAQGDGIASAGQRFFSNGALRRVGRYSYGMYVYHVPLFLIAHTLIFRHLPLELRRNAAFSLSYSLALGVVTFFIAMASYEWLERPILGLKYVLAPREANALPLRTSQDA